MSKYEVIITEENGAVHTLKEPKQYENLVFTANEYCADNIIRIMKPTKFIKGCLIDLRGRGGEITLESTKYAYNIKVLTASCALNQKLQIGTDCSFWTGISFNLTEDYAQIQIGKDCMFSKNIEIWASDGHAIYDLKSKHVINKCSDKIVIGNHVWIGSNVIFTKGGGIGNDSVVGTGTVVTKKFMEGNIIIAGNPARCIKHDINWNRKRPAHFESELAGGDSMFVSSLHP